MKCLNGISTIAKITAKYLCEIVTQKLCHKVEIVLAHLS